MEVVYCIAALMCTAVLLIVIPVEVREIKEIHNLPIVTDSQRKIQKICVTLRVLSVSLFVVALILGSIMSRLIVLFIFLLVVSQGMKWRSFSVERKLRDNISLSKGNPCTTQIKP